MYFWQCDQPQHSLWLCHSIEAYNYHEKLVKSGKEDTITLGKKAICVIRFLARHKCKFILVEREQTFRHYAKMLIC